MLTAQAGAGREAVLADLVRGHVPALRALGLATDRAPYAMRAADGTLVEVFEWASAAAIEAARQAQSLWRRLLIAAHRSKPKRLHTTQ